jgi:hypothetical protein
MTRQEMLKNMCLLELGQADVKAIGRSRGFENDIAASPALLQHVFLTEQGVREALASLTESELLGLHLLHHEAEPVGLEFFQRIYPDAVSKDLWGTHTARFKGLLQLVKASLIRRGVLIYCALPPGYEQRPVSERLRFCFPEEFGPCLPAPFQPRRLTAAASRQSRQNVVQEKLLEILELESAPVSNSGGPEQAHWRLADGELRFGGQPFSAARLQAWPAVRLAATFPSGGKVKAGAFQPVPLLLYALSRLREDEWLAPDDVVPLWRLAFAGAKVPEPRSICAAGFEVGLLEKAEQAGAILYRSRGRVETAPGAPPEDFADAQNPAEIRIRLDRISLEALQRLNEVSRVRIANGSLWAVPSLLKMSRATAATLEAPVLRWLREHHAAFRSVAANIEQRRGNLIVHHGLFVAKVNDPALKVMLEKEFGAPGQLVALSSDHVAFPNGLLPRVQTWMKKSGHVIKPVSNAP